MEEVKEDKLPHSVFTPNPPQVMDPSAHPTQAKDSKELKKSDVTKGKETAKKPSAKSAKKAAEKVASEKSDEDRKLAPREEL